MKVGDLVKYARSHTAARHLQSWVGIIIGFDKDDDPVVQWYPRDERRETIKPTPEYRDAVKVI